MSPSPASAPPFNLSEHLRQLFELSLRLEYPTRRVAVTHAPGQEWLFDVTLGPSFESDASATFLFELAEPPRDADDRALFVRQLYAVASTVLAGGVWPRKVVAS